MLSFFANPRDGALGDACNTCCCEKASGRPGETNMWVVDYGMWVMPFQGRGLTDNTSFEIEKIVDGSYPGQGNQPPTIPFIGDNVDFNTPWTINLATEVIDPEGNPITFKLLSIYGPQNGKVTIQPTGAVEYTPKNGYVGYDRFFYQADDNIAKAVSGEIILAVDPGSPAAPLPAPTEAMLTPDVVVRQKTVQVNNRSNTLTFSVEVSPTAVPGSVYRMQIRQQALSCNNEAYWHVSCYDITIGKC